MEQNSTVGLGFRPTDHELVYTYLRKKLDGVLTDCKYITEINIYDHEPWDLHDFSKKISKNDEFYFFHAPKYMGKKAQSCKRTTRAGFWKITGDPRKVRHEITNKEIGTKRTLVFLRGRGKGTPTEWVMHEYKYTEKHSDGESASKSNQGDFVLCKIFKKFNRKRGRSQLSFNTPTSSMDQNEVCHLMTPSASDKSETSCFNIDISSDFVNEDHVEIVATPLYKSESSFDTQKFAMDEIEPNCPVISSNKSESSFNTNTSFDFHDYNFGDPLNHNFPEGIVQGDSSQLISSSTNHERPEMSMYRDFTQNQSMCSDLPAINSVSDVLEELEAFWRTS